MNNGPLPNPLPAKVAMSAPQLKDASLFVGKNWLDNQWVESESGKRFDVTGMFL